MQTTNPVDAEIRVLQKESRTAETLQITYTFYRITTPTSTYYAAEIAAGEECDMQVLGSDSRRAEKLFEILVNETVTPCTLREILYDIETEEEKNRYRENLCKI